jgi:hypothetical protein
VKLSTREAFTLEPVATVKIGGTDFHVPPLTFGRLDELLGAVRKARLSSLTWFPTIPPGTSAEEIGRALVDFPMEDWEPLALATVPGLTPEAWKKATPITVIDLVAHFMRVHDWEFLQENLGIGEEGSEATDLDFEAALLNIARALGTSIERPLEYRAEGFFVATNAIRGARAAQEAANEQLEAEADGWTGPRPIEELIPIVTAPAPEGSDG